MKKIATLILLNLCVLSVTYAQLRVGIIGGPSSSSILETNDLPNWQTQTKPYYSNRSGFHAGFLVRVPLNASQSLFFQPAFLYQTKGNKYYKTNDTTVYRANDSVFLSREFSTNYVDVPLNLGYRFSLGKKAGFMVTAGPYVSFFYNGQENISTRSFKRNLSAAVDSMLSSTVKFVASENNIETGKDAGKVNTLDFGYNLRAGFEIGNVLLTAYYAESLSNFYNASYDGTFKHRVMGASIGFWLNKATVTEKRIKDKDSDGIEDKKDKCPELAGIAKYNGCPAPDSDKDGVDDDNDKCPTISGIAKYGGCPVPDTDKDGVNDEEDKCPEIAGLAKYNGCPVPDTDKDGVNDEEDKCPEIAGVVKYKGCPVPDTDKDGINDDEDKCPTEAGTAANGGCPEIKQEVIEKVNFAARNILFQLNSDVITKESFAGLDEVVEILKSNASLKIQIDGHSDNTGNAERNKMLSQKRAEAVKTYLVNKGVEAERLNATGYGQERPIADNKTKEGKARNRRVEMKLAQN